jgi:hypothetical protein
MDRVAMDVLPVGVTSVALESGNRLLKYDDDVVVDDDDDDDAVRQKDRSIGGGLMTYLGPLTLRINRT